MGRIHGALPEKSGAAAWVRGVMMGSLVMMGAACQGSGGRGDASHAESSKVSENAPSNTPARAKRPVVLFVGTSLTAGFGLDDPQTQAFPAVVGQLADSAQLPIVVKNAGVSGETSAGALQRVPWLLRDTANVVVIETGANDGLRGTSVATARDNIESVVRQFKAAWPSASIFLVQMEAPPNLGAKYVSAFHAMYGEVARAEGVTLTPFLLQGVAGERSFNQPDGVHPNVEGARKAAKTVWAVLEPVVRRYYL